MVTQKTKQPRKVPPHKIPQHIENEEIKAKLTEHAESIFEQFAEGKSFAEIRKSLPIKISYIKMVNLLSTMEETREMYANAKVIRSHYMADESLELGRLASKIGDAAGYRVAIDTNMKIAAALNPTDYGTRKVELTGKDGGALEMKADLTLTAEQAYERLIKGE